MNKDLKYKVSLFIAAIVIFVTLFFITTNSVASDRFTGEYIPKSLTIVRAKSPHENKSIPGIEVIDKYISDYLKIPVKMIAVGTQDEAAALIQNKKADIAFLWADTFAKTYQSVSKYDDKIKLLAQTQRYTYDSEKNLLSKKEYAAFYKSHLYVTGESKIHDFSELKGRRVGFLKDKESVPGWIFPNRVMRSNGLKDGIDYNIMTFDTFIEGMLALIKGDIDAVWTYSRTVDELSKIIPNAYKDIKSIASTEKIPNDTIGTRSDMERNFANNIFNALNFTMDKILSDNNTNPIIKKFLYGQSGYSRGNLKEVLSILNK